ncbi:MAG TPA: hypothetical protein VGB79_15785 [Allosphingosinicella sp.]|jgi:hypothetical protein
MPFAFRLLASTLLAFSAPAAAQEEDGPPPVDYPTLPEHAQAASGFVPAGWRLEASASGDLDRDGRSDLALVLRMNDPANVLPNEGLCGETIDTNPRILAIALAAAGGGYRLGVQDQELIPRRDNPCASDWFAPEHLRIERGAVRIDLERFMSAGGWDMGTTSFTFRWEDDNLRLIGFDYSNVKRNTGDVGGVSINYLTGRAKLTRGRIDEDRETVRWVTLHSRRPLTIWSVGDGLMYDPENLISSLP